MARKVTEKSGKDGKDKVSRARDRITQARNRLYGSILRVLIENVGFLECEEGEEQIDIGCVSPDHNQIWLNIRRKHELSVEEWTFALAHLLLHLGLGHTAAPPIGYHPVAWTLACEYVVDGMTLGMNLGKPPADYGCPVFAMGGTPFSGQDEETIYRALLENPSLLANAQTLAGSNRPDILQREPRFPKPSMERTLASTASERRDYANMLAEGIRVSVDEAVETAANVLGEADATRNKSWPPIEAARRWVMNELPLLGAIAAQLKVIPDAKLCDRMDIAVAAVNPYLGEIYFHTGRGLSTEEVLFVYIHELLHVALLHHTRLNGRDPYVWNLAADFVINGWLVEMGVGKFPHVGGLYDPRLKGMSAEEIYDLLVQNPRKCKGLAGFGGKGGDVLITDRRLLRGDTVNLDDLYRRGLGAGLACHGYGRTLVPAGLIEEIRSLFTPAVPWDVELARWMDANVPIVREKLRSYGRASRRQASTPDIPRPARYVPQEWRDASTFGVVLDTSGSMERGLLGRALGAIASYSEAREVPAVRLVLCDAAPYDRGYIAPTDLRGIFPVQGRGGTVLQPAINYLLGRNDFPTPAPIMIITDGWCEEELLVPREHCFLLPRKQYSEGNACPLRTTAPIFRILKDEREE